MDYNYIEQLLERYWECETNLEEEHILRTFFGQSDIPEHLRQYAPLFEYQQQESQMHLPDDFDQRILRLVEQETDVQPVAKTKVRVIGLRRRLAPLFSAAASVALFVMVGLAVEHASTRNQQNPNQANAAMADTYVRTENVGNVIQQALQPQEGIITAQADTLLLMPMIPPERTTSVE